MSAQPVNELQLLLKAIGYLRTHWWLLVLEVFVVYGISLNKFYHTPEVYESDASLLIDTARRQLYQSLMMSAGSASNARKQNMVHLLTSEEVFERFRTALTDYYNTEGRPIHLRSYFPGGSPFPAGWFRNGISLSWNRDSDIYNIHCSGPNADAAHDLCLIYTNTIQSYYPEIGQRDAMMKRDFLSRQIASFISQIKEREQNLTDFQKKNAEFFNFLSTNMEEKGLQRIRSEATAIKRRLASNRAIYKLILSIPRAKKGEHTARSAVIGLLTNKVAEIEYQIKLTEQSQEPQKEERLASLNAELSDVSQRLSNINEEEVAVFQKSPLPAADVKKRVSELELEYQTDLIRLSNAEKEIEVISAKEKDFNQPRLEYERLYMELNHKKKLLTNLYQKEQETELELSAGNAEIFRLQEATHNGHRTSPQLTKHLYGAMSICLFVIAVTLVLLIAFFPRIDSEAEVLRLNLPLLGKIPLVRKGSKNFDEIPGYGIEHLKIMNYRILRETRDIKCPVIVVSSAHAREGKSTITNFLTMASQGVERKTILIDGDLLTAHPNVFFGFKEDASPGLKSVLESEELPDLNTLIVKTEYEGVYFLPRGGRVDPHDLKAVHKSIEKLLTVLKKEYGLIYIDTPPLFASNLAHQFSSIADLVVLVARLFSTRPRDIQEAIQTCKVFTKAPVGIALNCIRITGPLRRASNYYFSKKKVNVTKIAA